MKLRAEPFDQPKRPPFLVCDLGEQGTYTFRIPSPGGAQKVLNAYSKVEQTDMAEWEEVAGRVVLDCWADGVWELEGDGGGAVFSELWEAGWSFDLIVGLVGALIEKMGEAMVRESEVSEKVAFFGETPSRNTSSTSGGCTSETCGGGTH